MKIIEFYFENGGSIVATQRSYTPFQRSTSSYSSRPAIMNLVTSFQEQGSVNDRSRRGRGRSVRTPENTEDVRLALKRTQPHPLEGVLRNLPSHGVLCSAFKETCACIRARFN